MSPVYKMLLATTAYMPKIPWKKGERDAFKTTRTIVNDLTIPIFVVPPAGDFDHDLGRILAPADHVKLFGKKLYESRGKRPVFIDAVYLDDERHRVDPAMGVNFSMGDARIVEIAGRSRGPGIAPTWKWAAFDHHLAMVGLPVAKLLGRVIEVPNDLIESPSTQLSLLSLLEGSPSAN
jgi:hypothetical protein